VNQKKDQVPAQSFAGQEGEPPGLFCRAWYCGNTSEALGGKPSSLHLGAFGTRRAPASRAGRAVRNPTAQARRESERCENVSSPSEAAWFLLRLSLFELGGQVWKFLSVSELR
jgi:hypothetical protein